MSTYILIPIVLIAAIAILFGSLVFLGRFRKGKYLRPLIMFLAKVPWLRRQFQKASQATIERENPELASAMRKLQRVGTNPTPQQAQQALSKLSANERRAYQEAVAEEGMVEPANRQQRRLQQKLQQGGRPASSGSKRSKRR